MSTAQTRSEAALAEIGCATVAAAGRPRVLIGGLGLGFTLRRVLELVPADARVQGAELRPPVVEWNRAHLRDVNGAQLDDARVEVVVGDVGAMLAAAPAGSYDAVLLDVDNGPTALVDARNARLYGDAGLRALARSTPAPTHRPAVPGRRRSSPTGRRDRPAPRVESCEDVGLADAAA